MSMLNARDSEQQDKVAAAKAEREAKKQQKMEQMRAMMAAVSRQLSVCRGT